MATRNVLDTSQWSPKTQSCTESSLEKNMPRTRKAAPVPGRFPQEPTRVGCDCEVTVALAGPYGKHRLDLTHTSLSLGGGGALWSSQDSQAREQSVTEPGGR